jgi:hypothetical protein
MSGGWVEENPVQVATKSPLVAPALNNLNQAFLSQQVQMALDSPDRAVEDCCQRLHLWPTESCLVVAEVAQAAVRWDHFGWDTGLEKIGNFGDTGKLLVNSHHINLSGLAAVCSMVRLTIRAAVLGEKECTRRFFYCFVSREEY